MFATACRIFWLITLVISFGVGQSLLAQSTPLNLNLERDWPWWRGPAGNGLVPGQQTVPTRFGENENLLWKSPVPGRGHSSPIVVNGKVYLATADEQDEIQSVLCYDLNNGKQEWQKTVNRGGFPANNHPKNTEASPTVASDGQRLFVTFFHHRQVELVAMTMSGDPVCTKKVCDFNPRMFEYGYAPSPVIFEDLIVVAAEYDGASFVVAYDRASGKEVWRTARPGGITFSSPIVGHVAGRDQLLLSGVGSITSYDPKTGTELWQVPGTALATCGTAVWNDDLVFASGGYPQSETLAVDAHGTGKRVWQNNQKCYEQSMILVDGFLYALTDKGVLYCWRGSDGQEMWRERLAGPVSSSPILANGNLYWANERGTIYVLRANSARFELVAENTLGSEIFASPAVSGNRLLWRVAEGTKENRKEFLYCFGNH